VILLRIAFAGSRDLPLRLIPRHVVEQLVRARKVILRRPRLETSPIGPFEQLVAAMAAALDIEVEWVAPEVGDRAQVFIRDLDMVGKADLVICYFSSPEMAGGTAHVVEAAMNKAVTCEAFYVSPVGESTWIGGYDPGTDGP
jgi:N-dimethylarginine dimethylaminohydrolase